MTESMGAKEDRALREINKFRYGSERWTLRVVTFD